MCLESLRDSIAKKAKGVHVSIMADSEIAKRDKSIPTPAYDLNRILSRWLKKRFIRKNLVSYCRSWTFF